ncbi:hypothetical protein HY486_01765 [Candidatus Woesearchaeota archaeon]|nr:hypothetical protein [Candidatus Woesearchaeota archaeon]
MKTSKSRLLAMGMLYLIMAIPYAVALESSADSEAVSVTKLRFRKFGEAVQDLFFSVRLALTFSDESRLSLLENRNSVLQERQSAWVKSKQATMAQFKAGNLSVEQKQKILASIQAEHQGIIKEHVELMGDVADIEVKAKAKQEGDTAKRAKAVAQAFGKSQLRLGLNIGSISIKEKDDDETEFEFEEELEVEQNERKVITEAEAKEIVRAEMDVTPVDVRLETRNGETFYVVTGTEAKTSGSATLTKEYEVWVSNIGIITAVDFDISVHAEAIPGVKISEESEETAEAEADFEEESEVGARAEFKSKGKVKVSLP